MMEGNKISDRVHGWCTSGKSVQGELANDPTLAPKKAAEKLFGHEKTSMYEPKELYEKLVPATTEDLERAFSCGNFGDTKPSELFLRMFHDALVPLEQDPLLGMVSPSLLGTTGVVPLTIIGPLPDICRHMSNMIARAEREVFLATNYWFKSDATRLITDALRELSKRAEARGNKVVVKILYDRGSAKQFVDNHLMIEPSQYSDPDGAVALPRPEEVPGLEMSVQNYHVPPFGTFHSKFMTIDRKYGVICSNNIQDNDNLEMACCLEGPVVDSLYDVCINSWSRALDPPLPSATTPAAQGGLPTFSDPAFRGLFDSQGNLMVPEAGPARSLQQVVEDAKQNPRIPLHAPADPHYDVDIAGEVTRMRSVLTPSQPGETQVSLIAEHLNRATHIDTKGTAPEPARGEEFTPYIPISVHKPVPMALVNRKAYGLPSHASTYSPQTAAWLSALKNAKKYVFMQTPDLNAAPLLPAIVDAVKRGIEVTYYVCLGYNDAGELLPRQGGHNEMVAAKLKSELTPEERKRLRIAYYVGADQIAPIHHKFTKRSCHIKLMIVDGQVAIQGNGNLDTQSWYHSQETNVMIDSADICAKWEEGIRRNQNTHLYGLSSEEDGVWRDADGKEAEGAVGVDPGRFSWAKGFMGAVQRVRGVGGFG